MKQIEKAIFRFKTLTLTINGIQIDIQAAIIISSSSKKQVSFQHIYFARVEPGGDNFPSTNISTICTKNPCQNGGYCVVLSKTTYNCLCTAGWGGRNKNKKI